MYLVVLLANDKMSYISLTLNCGVTLIRSTIISICTVYIVMSCGAFCNFEWRKSNILFFVIIVTIIATIKVTS